MTLLALLSLLAAEPPFAWREAAPETCGLSSEALAALGRHQLARGGRALLIIRHDTVVHETYAEGMSRQTKHSTASLAKSIVGGIALGLALDDGAIDPDEPASKYVAAWRDSPDHQRILVRHLATHCSGMSDSEHVETGWEAEFWGRDANPFLVARDRAPMLFEPGSAFQYSNPGMAMLAWCVTAATGRNARDELAARVMEPIGADPAEWTCGYGRTWPTDGLPLVPNWGGGSYSPDAVARVGRLMLRRGDWQGRRILGAATLDRLVADAGAPLPRRDDPAEGPRPRPGLCWWHNADGVFASLPRDAYFGAGAGQEFLAVVPSLDLIVVRFGNQARGTSFWGGLEEDLLNPLMAAVVDEHPADRIGAVRFGDEIRRDAVGSDNWPLTWADDDALYTSYGDGWGFEPRTEAKLSQGFARITGGPEDHRAENLRTATGERLGNGAAGPKASGLLCLDGTLYALVRNVGNSQLIWSTDHGATWEWGFAFDQSFGCPAFCNFGRDYSGARDGFVYVYSSDGPSAYERYDRVVLARAPRDRLRERAAWSFYAGRRDGEPVWSADIAERTGVLTRLAGCRRLDVAFNAGLGCYLMALAHDDAGGWGLYAAPEPWGPWRAVWQTDDWGLGQTHGYRLPTKWMSADGRTLWLVFSGRNHAGVEYDAFCLRRVELLPPQGR